jgi:predicted dehydrogenase
MTSVGFVGLGLIGARRAKIAQSLGVKIDFIVDRDPARFAGAPVDGCCYASSVDELDQAYRGHTDAILIAVPHNVALDVCSWAFARRSHVLCEKPMGLNLGEAKRIAGMVEATGKHFCAGFNYRYLAGVAALRDLIREGKLGRVSRARLAMGHGGRPGMETEWKLKRASAGGGALIDPGIHLVDLALHLFGAQRVDNVNLRRDFWNSDVEDSCRLILASDEGVDISIEVTLTSWKNQFEIEVYGSDALAILTGRGGNYGTQRLEVTGRWFWQGATRPTVLDLGSQDPSFELETQAFLELVATGGTDVVLSDAAAGCAALAIVEQAYDMTPAPAGL